MMYRLGQIRWYEVEVEAESLEGAQAVAMLSEPELVDSTDWEPVGEEDRV